MFDENRCKWHLVYLGYKCSSYFKSSMWICVGKSNTEILFARYIYTRVAINDFPLRPVDLRIGGTRFKYVSDLRHISELSELLAKSSFSYASSFSLSFSRECWRDLRVNTSAIGPDLYTFTCTRAARITNRQSKYKHRRKHMSKLSGCVYLSKRGKFF